MLPKNRTPSESRPGFCRLASSCPRLSLSARRQDPLDGKKAKRKTRFLLGPRLLSRVGCLVCRSVPAYGLSGETGGGEGLEG